MQKSKRWVSTIAAALTAATLLPLLSARANPELVFDVNSGDILYQQEAAKPWYPASLTKLMTVYVALKLVKDGKFSFDSPFIVTRRAAVMQPAKMGFAPGTVLTLGNALKFLMVKSANDVAVTVAEGMGGSVEGFAALMNHYAAKLGMAESHFVTPNGLPDPRHVASARDLALLATALYREFPEEAGLFSIGELQFGNKYIHTFNGLLGRYPGADGMKTGFTCAAGFNIVAGATRQGRHLIAIVLGQQNVKERNATAADLLEAAFDGKDKGSGHIQDLPVLADAPPDMHQFACGPHRHSSEAGDETEAAATPATASDSEAASGRALPATSATAAAPQEQETIGAQLAHMPKPEFTPVPVYIGQAPGKELAVTPVVANAIDITPFPPRHARRVARNHHMRVVHHGAVKAKKAVQKHKVNTKTTSKRPQGKKAKSRS
ncbi:MAG: serine hydrolase [Hyphomicrobiales bacterium]|nr:serine hydrolase [Hyphomicrobiales bacterium]MDE2115362.1 serine hydrolase [Hyphomicrobiales bacterium]